VAGKLPETQRHGQPESTASEVGISQPQKPCRMSLEGFGSIETGTPCSESR
jgi:hypothetical protein